LYNNFKINNYDDKNSFTSSIEQSWREQQGMTSNDNYDNINDNKNNHHDKDIKINAVETKQHNKYINDNNDESSTSNSCYDNNEEVLYYISKDFIILIIVIIIISLNHYECNVK